MTRAELDTLKDAVDLRELLGAGRDGKVQCPNPAHDDQHPSCEVYRDHLHCFACGWHGDVLEWLQVTRGLDFAGAVGELEQLAGHNGAVCKRTLPSAPGSSRAARRKRSADVFTPIRTAELQRHRELVADLALIPRGIERRGFTIPELRRLQVANTPRGAVLAITGPTGEVLALKVRLRELWRGQRYIYATPGHGSPAWCSPDFQHRVPVLIMEGELNGMAAWLARPDLAVMGTAGANGRLHLEALAGRTVYMYADPDEPGRQAVHAWGEAAIDAGARRVLTLEPWPLDACDIAGRYGRKALRLRISAGMRTAEPFEVQARARLPRRARLRRRLEEWTQ